MANLIRLYQLFLQECQSEYREDVFKRYAKPFDQTVNEEHYELILENGFLIYTLILRYLQNKSDPVNNIDYDEFHKKKESFQTLTFIKELKKLGGSLFQHGLDVMKRII
jgi:hypothetical protein